MSRTIEVVSHVPGFVWSDDALRRFFAVLDAHPIGQDIPPGTLAIAFVSPEESARLHGEFFDDPTPTDIMTFPGDEDEDHAGDLAICPTVALESARQHETPFSEEIALYLIHGCLHLAGRDDRTPADTARMRADETTLLLAVRTAQALPPFTLQP
ncbi:MAG: rRNA maturation RNase YbeY [Opitutales bacterium]|nr:rRNA maturation RNase YbeY [Opitutales bacterium]